MKNILTLLTVLLLSQSLISQMSLDLEKSKIKWTGKKITNASHWGSLSFSEANLDFDGDDLVGGKFIVCLLYTSPSPRDKRQSRMPSSA